MYDTSERPGRRLPACVHIAGISFHEHSNGWAAWAQATNDGDDAEAWRQRCSEFAHLSPSVIKHQTDDGSFCSFAWYTKNEHPDALAAFEALCVLVEADIREPMAVAS